MAKKRKNIGETSVEDVAPEVTVETPVETVVEVTTPEAPVEAETAPETTETVVPEVSTDNARKARWEAFLERYEKQNPAKYASRKENGEFNKIPDSFV